MDLSVQFESHGIKFNIFWVLENMPTCGARDLILIRNAKVSILNTQCPVLSLMISRSNGEVAVSLLSQTLGRQFM
jgi:hypothetical protein